MGQLQVFVMLLGKKKEKEECLKLKEVAQNRCYTRTVKFALVYGPAQ